jgi:hypothetical protein
MKEQFEKDNIFYFSEDACNNLKEKRIWLSYMNLIINEEDYDKVRNKVKKGVKLDWFSIRKLKNIDRIAIMDVIDESRANRGYLDLLQEMKMNQRVSSIEKWLLSNEWKSDEVKKIKNIHYVVKPEKEMIDRII